MLDLMRWTSGREFTAVAGFETRKGREVGEMETATASVLQLDNGGLATLRVDYFRPETPFLTEMIASASPESKALSSIRPRQA